jgi:hypothetical protein
MAETTKTDTTTATSASGRLDAARTFAAHAAGVAVDTPIGAALAIGERAGELAGSGRSSARAELTRVGVELQGELDQAGRRGARVRRHFARKARKAGTRFERNLNDWRRGLERTLDENRVKATQRVCDAEASMRRGRDSAERRTREAIDRVTSVV